MVFSEVAVRLGFDNTPGPAVTTNLTLVAAFMEKIRTLLCDKPIVVHSGYRSVEANGAVGGVATSAHSTGWHAILSVPHLARRRKWRSPF